MRFLRHVSWNMTVLLSLGPVLLSLGPVITPVPGNQECHHCQNSAKTVPNRAIPLNQLQPATAETRVTSKRPKNNTLIRAYPGYGVRAGI